MKQFFNRYELVFFFLFTYALSWVSVPVADGALIPHGPMIAAVLIIALTKGSPAGAVAGGTWWARR